VATNSEVRSTDLYGGVTFHHLKPNRCYRVVSRISLSLSLSCNENRKSHSLVAHATTGVDVNVNVLAYAVGYFSTRNTFVQVRQLRPVRNASARARFKKKLASPTQRTSYRTVPVNVRENTSRRFPKTSLKRRNLRLLNLVLFPTMINSFVKNGAIVLFVFFFFFLDPEMYFVK